MTAIRRLVVAVLLGVWCFPAVSVARPLPAPSTDVASRSSPGASPTESTQGEESALGAREQQSPDLQNFRGGGVYIYLGGGAVLILLIILLIVLI